jgi:hypothetical protein
MKHSILALCLVYLMLLMGCAVGCKRPIPVLPQIPQVSTPQKKAAHSLIFLNAKGEEVAQCSATAIGPHALLTALHCDKFAQFTSMTIDLSTSQYHIVSGIADDRDHLIIIVDGPAFKNTTTVIQRAAVIGEHVFMYGYGGNIYPARRRDGVVIAERNGGDESDVDALATTTNYSFPAIMGDSGSAVYGNDGAIVGLLTYSRPGVQAYSTGFSLNFPQDVLDKAATLQ